MSELANESIDQLRELIDSLHRPDNDVSGYKVALNILESEHKKALAQVERFRERLDLERRQFIAIRDGTQDGDLACICLEHEVTIRDLLKESPEQSRSAVQAPFGFAQARMVSRMNNGDLGSLSVVVTPEDGHTVPVYLKPAVPAVPDVFKELLSGLTALNRSNRQEVPQHITSSDEPCYWQKEGYLDWITDLAEQSKAALDSAPAPVNTRMQRDWKWVPRSLTGEIRHAFNRANEEFQDEVGYESPDHQWQAMLDAIPEFPITLHQVPFQYRVKPWLIACFGESSANNPWDRVWRFLEEALELAQACSCTAEHAHELVDYVFGRAVGERTQEVGGVMVTLAALCLAYHIDLQSAAETELDRINQPAAIEKIRAKQARKPAMSPLPGPDSESVSLDYTPR